jgi:O-methyltransferase involved in polyketide biosynthesis
VAACFGAVDVDHSTMVGCCLRNLVTDRWLGQLASQHPDGLAAVVDIGVGLNTRLQRHPSVTHHYLELDTEPVLAFRDTWLPSAGTDRIVADGMRTEAWVTKVDPHGPIAVVLEGVLTYQEPAAVQRFFAELAEALPGAYVVFDSVSPLAAHLANRSGPRAQGRPRYRWAAWQTKRIPVNGSHLQIMDERGLLDVTPSAALFSRTDRVLYAMPPMRRAYRLTFAQLPGKDG